MLTLVSHVATCRETWAAKLDKILLQTILPSSCTVFSKEEEFTEAEHDSLMRKRMSWKGL